MKEVDNILKVIGGLVLAAPVVIALIAALAVWHGFVLSVLWGWFMVPGFGMQPISIPLAIGLSLLAGSFTARAKKQPKDDEPLWLMSLRAAAIPAMTLFIGWVVTKFL